MSTAKSMAAQYLSAKRQQQQVASRSSTPLSSNRGLKSSTSNLAATTTQEKNRLKSTSMTNLSANNQAAQSNRGSTIHRPASRNALDSIHCGMNAKYAQVQSKVLLQNIRPQESSQKTTLQTTAKTAATGRSNSRLYPASTGSRTIQRQAAGSAAAADKQALANKVKSLQDELEKQVSLTEQLRGELEREKSDKVEQVQQLKLELQEKASEYERQNEDYHQKLLEAYELADQNRRAAETVLHESRQRDEESRTKIDELESQLNELREFVSMKEEMSGKMVELRDQLKEERERYETQLRNLHQVFENEKLSQNKLYAPKRSKYFSRIKPSLLQSSESINQNNTCSNCSINSGQVNLHPESGQQHRSSEHDLMYGSKLSTRMQDGAKSAWRASKQFASSVITGKMSLSACRSHRKSGSDRKRRSSESVDAAAAVAAPLQQTHQVISNKPQQSLPVATHSVDEQLTSVIKVCAEPISVVAQQQTADSVITTTSDEEQAGSNKLTIVTRFVNGSDATSDAGIGSNASSTSATEPNSGSSPTQLTPVSKGESTSGSSPTSSSSSSSTASSERSRCESSSSGRGTVAGSDTDSSSHNGSDAATDNGHSLPVSSNDPQCKPTRPTETSVEKKPAVVIDQSASKQTKTHKRKSSLFKASKVFSQSQLSLNKLRTFFTAAPASKTATGNEVSRTTTPPDANEAISAAEREIRLLATSDQIASASSNSSDLASSAKDVEQTGDASQATAPATGLLTEERKIQPSNGVALQQAS